MVGVGSSQLTQVTHGSSADLTVHVHLLHLVFWTHEHLRQNNSKLKSQTTHTKDTYRHTNLTKNTHCCDQTLAEVKQEDDLYWRNKKKHPASSLRFVFLRLKIEFESALFLLPRSSSELITKGTGKSNLLIKSSNSSFQQDFIL